MVIPGDLVLILLRQAQNGLVRLDRVALDARNVGLVRRLEIGAPAAHIRRYLNHIVPDTQPLVRLKLL